MKYLNACLLMFLLFVFSCVSPEKALMDGSYPTAFRSSVRQIKHGKNMEKNLRVLNISAHQLVEQSIADNTLLLQSNNLQDWIKAEKSTCKLRNKLQKANRLTSGAVQDQFIRLDSFYIGVKRKIVQFYFQTGTKKMALYEKTRIKTYAREAYPYFDRALKQGGTYFYPDLRTHLQEALAKGIIYYTGEEHTVGESRFLKPLPKGANFELDCHINIMSENVNYDYTEYEKTQEFTKKILVNTIVTRDTAAKEINTKCEYETLSATVTTKEITIVASVFTTVQIDNISGQCPLNSVSFYVNDVDVTEEIEIDGDEEAVPDCIKEKDANVFCIEMDLRSAVNSEIDDRLNDIFHIE